LFVDINFGQYSIGGKALRLSHDHKGTDEEEVKRITDLGGFVVLNRVNGILAVTRALGDHNMKEYVTAEPYITTTDLPEDTESTNTFLILACDGVCTPLSFFFLFNLVVGCNQVVIGPLLYSTLTLY
jgi:serine/threonine protein phosphatase PrpC